MATPSDPAAPEPANQAAPEPANQAIPDPDTDELEAEASYTAAYDIDGDGEVSAVEDARAALGVADAKLEQLAEEGGVTGKIAEAAHHVVDKLDND